MRKFISAVYLIAFSVTCSAQDGWKTYKHPNGYSLTLPPTFKKGLLVASGTLQYFDNKENDSIVLTIETFGRPSELRQDFEGKLRDLKHVTYSVFRPTWYVISWKDDEGVHYNKTIVKGGSQQQLMLTYPNSQVPYVDKILKRVVSSFQ